MQRETIMACTESLEAKYSEVIPIIDRPYRSGGRAILLLSMMGGTALFVLGLFCLSFFTVKAQSRPVQTAAPTGPIIIFPIGLPDAQTVYVQTITQTAQITLTWRAFLSATTPGGTVPEPLLVLTATIPAEALRVYTAPIHFEGGAILESDAPVYVANLTLSERGNRAYVGFQGEPVAVDDSALPATLSTALGTGPSRLNTAPQAMYAIQVDRFVTRYCIQNIAEEDAVVEIVILDEQDNQTSSELVTLPAKASRCFLPERTGRAVIQSNQPLEVFNLELEDTIQGLRADYAVVPSGGYTSSVFVPALFKEQDQQSSRLCIQNASTLTNTTNLVDVQYTDGLTHRLAFSRIGEGVCLDQSQEGHAPGWEGGATIVATDAVAVGVIVFARDANDTTRGVWAYAPPTQVLADQRGVALPALFNGKDEWHSTVYLYNPSPQSATVIPRLIDRSGAILCTESLTIPANTVTTFTLNPEEHAFTEGMGYFHSTTPLAAAVRGASAKAVDDITDRFYGYEAAYFDVRSLPSHPPTPCTSEGLVYDEYYAEQEREYASIGAPAMWQRGLTGIAPGRAITVAVIDTGVANHPDLVDNLISGYNFVAGEPPDSWQDTSSDSHGTMVAGIIAARMNNNLVVNAEGRGSALGMVGIGGGDAARNVMGLRIMPLRIVHDQSDQALAKLCRLSAEAIHYAMEHGAQLINMSYNSGGCAEERRAVEAAYAAGLILVAGAGNNNSDSPVYPAAYGAGDNEDLVIAVAGVYTSKQKGDSSSFGEWVDLSAPYHARSLTQGASYTFGAGTSFSAAYVSGLIGVLMSNKGWSRAEVLVALRSSADSTDAENPSYTQQLGAGRINADQASTVAIQALYLPFIQR